MIFIRDIIQGFKNLFYYSKVIWNDRWWDHSFFFILLRHKLIQMEKNLRTKGIHLNAKKDAFKIKKCILTLDRIIEDNYHENAFRNHEKKYGKLICSFIECDDNSDLLEMISTRENIKTEKDNIEERKQSKILYEHEKYLEDQDINFLFNTLKKHIRTWWD